MEQRKAIGLVVLGAAVGLLILGAVASGGGAGEFGGVLTGIAFLVLNPLTLAIILVLMFRRPRGQQQQQQVVIHVAAGGSAPHVQVRCGTCNALNAATSRFCAQCGKPTLLKPA